MKTTVLKRSSTKLLKVFIVFSMVIFPLSLGVQRVEGDQLYAISDVIEDSRPSTASNHTITFTTQTLVEDDDSTITVTFPAGFTMGSVDETDIDISDDAADKETEANCAGSDEVGVSVALQVVTFQICAGETGDIAAGSVVVIEIGDNAQYDGAGVDQIVNHATPAYYDIVIGGTWDDDGTTKIVIVDTLTARVTVDETMSFTITAVNLATCDDRPGDNVNEVATTVATLVDFGDATLEEFYDACHEMEVGTNAANGYSVTVTESDQLSYGSDQIADGVCDSICTETVEETWATSANNGFGYCLDDITGDAGATADATMDQCDHGTTPEYKIFPELDIDTPEFETVMSSAAGLTTNDETHLGYRVTLPSTTAAGTFENRIILVATPTY